MTKLISRLLPFAATLCIICLNGCTIATHDTKNKYWAMQPEMGKLPPVGVIAPNGYISYPLLISRKDLFEGVANCANAFPAEVEINITGGPSDNIALALSWLIISGSSGFIIPYRADNPRYAEFIVKIKGEEVRRFKYEDRKYIWIASLGMPFGALSKEHDEYYVEELMADQFVNSFIIDLYKDKELIQKLKAANQKI